MLLVGSPAGIERAKASMGREEPGRLSRDRANYDVVRVYVSKAAFVGKPLREIALPDFPVMISHVRRGDVELVASSDLTIEFGDRLVVAVPAGRQAEVRRYFGDSIKGNAEMSFVSIGVGMALGLLLGMIPVPLPGGGTFSLGVAGGPLVMALVLGWLGRTGPIGWRMPVVANLVLRNLGLSVFIGSVAIGAGAPFVQTVASNGIQILLGGAAVLLTLVLIVLVGGYLLRIPFDDLLGVCAGSTGNPAILSAAGAWRRPSGPTSAMRSVSRARRSSRSSPFRCYWAEKEVGAHASLATSQRTRSGRFEAAYMRLTAACDRATGPRASASS